MSIALTLRHRGTGGTIARAGSILARFGVTAEPMARRLTHYTDLVTEFDARPSFPEREPVSFRAGSHHRRAGFNRLSHVLHFAAE